MSLSDRDRRVLDAARKRAQVYTWPKDYGDGTCWRGCGIPIRPGDRVCFTGPSNLIGDIPREPAHERCEAVGAKRGEETA